MAVCGISPKVVTRGGIRKAPKHLDTQETFVHSCRPSEQKRSGILHVLSMCQSTEPKSCLLFFDKTLGTKAQVQFEIYSNPDAQEVQVSQEATFWNHLWLRITESTESLNPPRSFIFLLFHGSACSTSFKSKDPGVPCLVRIDLSPFTPSEHCEKGKFYLSFKTEQENKEFQQECCRRLKEQARKRFPDLPDFDVAKFKPKLDAAFLNGCQEVSRCLIRFKERNGFKDWPTNFGKMTDAQEVPEGKACRYCPLNAVVLRLIVAFTSDTFFFADAGSFKGFACHWKL